VKKTFNTLKSLLIIEIIIGLFGASFLAIFVGIMATDSPSSTYLHMAGGGLVGFMIVFVPSVLLPYLSIRELRNYTENKKIVLNIIQVSDLIHRYEFTVQMSAMRQLDC